MKSRRFRHVSILLALLLVMQPFLGYMPTVMAQESLESGSIDVNELMGHQEEADFHEENLDTSDTGNADVQVEEGEKSEVKDSEAKDHAAKNESEAKDHKETPNQESTKKIDSAKVEEKQTKGTEEDKHHRLEVLDFTPENPYYVDFTNGNNGELKAEEGNMEVKYEDGYANVSTIGQTLVHDAKAPKIENGVLEMNMQFTEDDPSRFGFIFRYQDKGNYAALLKDAGNWVIHYKEDGKPTNQNVPALADVTFKKDTDYDVKLVYDEIYLTLFINGEEIINTTASNVPHKAGKIGIRSWFNNKTFKLDSITNYSLDSNSEEETGNLVEILHHETKVVVDDSFPRIDHYEWNGNTIDGYQKGLNSIRINNTRYVPTVSFRKLSDDVAEYQLTVPELAEILLQIKATANGVDINVTDIKELSDNMLVRTLDIPNLGLVSINSKDNEVAQEAAAWSTGAWHGLFEEYHDLHDVAEVVSGGRTFAFLNTDTYAATILNNVVDGNDKVRVNIDADGTGNNTAAMWNGSWTYHENNALDPEPLPWSKIVFTDDQNDDGVVDWQDAAIAYRNIAETTVADGYLLAPYRHELVRDHISYISFNIGSQAGMPFLRQFDNAKKIANLTDDFGQLVLYKGYQAEGHDDSHPDYGGHIGIRQGGEEDFNYVLREGKKRNIIGGVHINATEYMLDAFETKMENLTQPLVNGWGWMDASYYVDQYKDVVTGELERRLNMLKDDTGDHLSFVYVDVYSGVDYKAKKLAEYINNNGWMLGTEFAGPLFEQVAWTHWGTDPGYPNQGNENKIIRFMRNHVMDGFMSHPMLKGLQQSGVGYWQDIPENKSFHKTQEVFYVHNLPTKYMQYFPIVKWEDDRIEMEQNVHVQREDDGKIHLYKDDKLIAIMSDSEDVSQSTVFIPWNPLTEEKVYHWNPNGGKTTWDVPNSWKDASSAMLYKLTDLGREFVEEVSIDNGKVELDVDAKTGYVLYLKNHKNKKK
ncbi:endo-alpha-N-acetylgalactosaminidase family protein [Paracerasibacillus soli]|uniref:Endo-alpha-N-acetylgalactosaminidase family protein n=1 Tax=Paracerasibacillus soli TaxID=480284 RepID=A0ABU5CS96_9BACI|nr:endo-alpha-N-acetylgalactosaminidase family protein [Virgibacillus soli]MDY0409249.1 endo-alpha-N-acetylgalactosaminidase family protein [Virgibacillus soli]